MAGAVSFWIIQDFPDTAKFLTEKERAFVIRRLQEDDQFSAAGEKLKWKFVRDSLTDWKTWMGSECLFPISHVMCSWTRLAVDSAYIRRSVSLLVSENGSR